MIESEFALLKMQVKGMTWDSIKLGQPPLRKAPERLDAIDVVTVDAELVQVMADSEVLGVPHIYQAIVTTPTVAVDHGLKADTSTDYLLQRGFATIGYDLGIDTFLSLKDSEHDSFPSSSSAVLPANPAWPKVGFIHFHGPADGGLCFADLGKSLPDPQEKRIHGTDADSSHPRCLTRRQVFAETPHNGPKTPFFYLRTFVVPINSFHIRSIHPSARVCAS